MLWDSEMQFYSALWTSICWAVKWELFYRQNFFFFFSFSQSFLSSSSCFLDFRDVSVSLSAAGAPWHCDRSGRWRHGLRLRYFCPALRRPSCVCGLQEGIHQHTSSSWGGEDPEIEWKWDNIRKKTKYMLKSKGFSIIWWYIVFDILSSVPEINYYDQILGSPFLIFF